MGGEGGELSEGSRNMQVVRFISAHPSPVKCGSLGGGILLHCWSRRHDRTSRQVFVCRQLCSCDGIIPQRIDRLTTLLLLLLRSRQMQHEVLIASDEIIYVEQHSAPSGWSEALIGPSLHVCDDNLLRHTTAISDDARGAIHTEIVCGWSM